MKDQSIKISVIIPVFNSEKYLKECLNSVIEQTLKDIEIICVDDGSTDNSLSILEEYKKKDKRLTILKQQHKGAGAARNLGLDMARGGYLYFLDSDDFIKQNALEILHNQITKVDADICICKNNIYNTTKKIFIPCVWQKAFSQIPAKDTFNSTEIPNSILQICNIPAYTKLYKTNFIKKNNIKFQEIQTCNDVYFNNISLILAKKITSINEVLITYREGHNNLSKTRHKHIKNILLAYNHIITDLKKREKFELVKNSIYQRAYSNFTWELSKISNPLKRLYNITQ